MLWVRISIRARCTTLCNKVCQWLATGRWFSLGPPQIKLTAMIFITEILLKVALNTINPNPVLWITTSVYPFGIFNLFLLVLKGSAIISLWLSSTFHRQVTSYFCFIGFINGKFKVSDGQQFYRYQQNEQSPLTFALDSQPQVIKCTSCLPMVGGSLWILRFPPPLKLVTMI